MQQPTDQATNPYEEQINISNGLIAQIDACISAIDAQASDTPIREFIVVKERLLEAKMHCRRIVEKANEPGINRENADLAQPEDIREMDVREENVPDAVDITKPKDAPEAGSTDDPATEQPSDDPHAFDDSQDSEPYSDLKEQPKSSDGSNREKAAQDAKRGEKTTV